MANVSPSEAVHGFVSWLLSRKESAGPFSLESDVFEASDLCERYCAAQGWTPPEADWLLRVCFPDSEADEEGEGPGQELPFVPRHDADQVADYLVSVAGDSRLQTLWAMLGDVRKSEAISSGTAAKLNEEMALLDQILKSLVALSPSVSRAIQALLEQPTTCKSTESAVPALATPATDEFKKRLITHVSSKWATAATSASRRACPICGELNWFPSPFPVYVASQNGLLLRGGFAYLSCTTCGYTMFFNAALLSP